MRRCILGSILESEKNYLDALKRILEVSTWSCSNCLIHSEVCALTVHFFCCLSNMRSPCPRSSQGCWATGNWKWPSIACERSCSAISSSKLLSRAVWLSGTAWRWSEMCLWLRWAWAQVLKLFHKKLHAWIYTSLRKHPRSCHMTFFLSQWTTTKVLLQNDQHYWHHWLLLLFNTHLLIYLLISCYK